MNLILTFDYELYGDGSGDVFNEMIYPTSKILNICNEYNIKTTIFFEVIEYIKLKEEWQNGNTMGYKKNPIEAIDEQLKNALIDGHDIQMHIHPQWIDANYRDGCWSVNFSNWRLGDFKHKNYSTYDILKNGKDVIENLLKTIDVNYKCIALRAGGYNIMPSFDVYNAMKKLDLKLDSSIYPGGYEDGSLSKYDYRGVSIHKDYWIADKNDLRFSSTENKDHSIYEIPIFAMILPRWKKINFFRIKSFLKNRKSSIKSFNAKTQNSKTLNKFKFFFEKEALTWDFCLFQMSLHKYFIKYIINSLSGKRNSFVLIGHPKGFSSSTNFRKFINYAKKKNFTFCSLARYYKRIIHE